MANLQERAGSVVVRLGGNTQEYAKLVDSNPDGHTFQKDMTDLQGTVCFDHRISFSNCFNLISLHRR